MLKLKNLYNKYILPKYLDFGMRSNIFDFYRKKTIDGVTGNVLEIGFGSGVNLPYYKNIQKLYALEPSSEVFNLAKNKIEHCNFVVEHLSNMAESIPLPDNSIDYVVSTFTFCTIPNPHLALQEITRVLKVGGQFVFLEHGKSTNKFLYILQKIGTPISRLCAGGCELDRDIPSIITGSKLKIQSIQTLNIWLKPLNVIYSGVAIKNT
jgi:ubiquinone/menaquinone biosynthesis C-methylase UbiE